MISIKPKMDNLTGHYSLIFHKSDTNQIVRWETKNNGDLIWRYVKKNNENGTSIFTVSNTDYELYNVIEQLYLEIKEGQIYINDINVNIDFRRANKNDNVKFATSNMYDPRDNSVKWFSDDGMLNAIKIVKLDNCYQISFSSKEKEKIISVLFKQTGSFYECGSIPFLRGYNRLLKIVLGNGISKNNEVSEKVLKYKKSA